MAQPRVLIVDDHKLFAEGVAQVLKTRCDVVGQLPDGSMLMEVAARLRPDLILLDMSLPNGSGLDLLRDLKRARLESHVIILTMHRDPRLAAEALKAGASGFLLKEATADELMAAVDAVLDGRVYLTSALTAEVLSLMAAPAAPAGFRPTPRQRDVLRLVVQGQRVKGIAAALQLSPRSVEAVKYQIMQELNLHSTAALVRYALEHDLVAP
jgi:DNA-binding NarL/FixJ family response regulator